MTNRPAHTTITADQHARTQANRAMTQEARQAEADAAQNMARRAAQKATPAQGRWTAHTRAEWEAAQIRQMAHDQIARAEGRK